MTFDFSSDSSWIVSSTPRKRVNYHIIHYCDKKDKILLSFLILQSFRVHASRPWSHGKSHLCKFASPWLQWFMSSKVRNWKILFQLKIVSFKQCSNSKWCISLFTLSSLQEAIWNCNIFSYQKAISSCWPILDKTQCREFRSVVLKFLEEMKKQRELPLSILLRKSILDDSRNERYFLI